MEYYLITLQPSRPGLVSKPTEREVQIVNEHFQYFKNLTEQGKAIIVGRTDEVQPIGIALLKTGSLKEAEDLFQNDPAVQNKIMQGKVKPFRLALVNVSGL